MGALCPTFLGANGASKTPETGCLWLLAKSGLRLSPTPCSSKYACGWLLDITITCINQKYLCGAQHATPVIGFLCSVFADLHIL